MNGWPFILLHLCWCCVAVFWHSLERWHILFNPRTHRGGFTCAVCGKWHTRQVNYSPFCCTPLHLSKEGGLNTRGRPSHFILIFYRWGKIKMHYTVQKLCLSSAGFWTGLAVSCGVCFRNASAKFCLKKQIDTVSFWRSVCEFWYSVVMSPKVTMKMM